MRGAGSVAEQVRLLRFLADQLEAGRAHAELEISQDSDVVDDPRSWFNLNEPPNRSVVYHGCRWSLRAATLDAIPRCWPKERVSSGRSLFEYLDKLEATAKAATTGTWHYGQDATHVTADDFLMIRTTGARDAEHVIATQPAATLALIAKLREAVDIVRRATEIASMTASDWRANGAQPADVINRFQDQVVEWARIEVPTAPPEARCEPAMTESEPRIARGDG